MSLTPIGPGNYGTRYAFSGVIPLAYPDVSDLSWGDTVRDNGGKGMSMSVNECCECGAKYLAGTLILVPERGPCCARRWR